MNRTLFRDVIAVAACAVVSSSALAQPKVKPPTGAALTDHITITCKDPNNPGIFRQADGGYLEPPQGWFYGASVEQAASGWAQAYCRYGMQKLTPSKTPVYTVHYELTGFKSNQCKVSGKVVSCGREPVIKP